jgi:putative SOS response-associated peptidase YedK
MCGRYAAAKDPDALAEEFEVVAKPEETLSPDYNVAPTKKVYVVLDRPAKEPDPEDAVAPRSLVIARWGLVPSWAKDPSIGSRMINARAETVAEKPAFRRAFAKRRCLVPADGYYEWYLPTSPDAPTGKGGKPLKQPFYIHPDDGSSLAMAGLYEWWHDKTREDDDPQAWRLTCTVITTEASDDVGRIHDRMPMTIGRGNWDAWLDPAVGSDDAGPLLVPAMAGSLVAIPVSTMVNSVRNNGPELVRPLPLEDLPPGTLF